MWLPHQRQNAAKRFLSAAMAVIFHFVWLRSGHRPSNCKTQAWKPLLWLKPARFRSAVSTCLKWDQPSAMFDSAVLSTEELALLPKIGMGLMPRRRADPVPHLGSFAALLHQRGNRQLRADDIRLLGWRTTEAFKPCVCAGERNGNGGWNGRHATSSGFRRTVNIQ
jgi:hypothetical protein